VTAANADGDSIYDLTLTVNKTATGALISATQSINTDGGKHGSFDALVWAPNSFTGTLDLIVADASKGQILRYSGPNYGTSTAILYEQRFRSALPGRTGGRFRRRCVRNIAWSHADQPAGAVGAALQQSNRRLR
jgi:hypothetical protein